MAADDVEDQAWELLDTLPRGPRRLQRPSKPVLTTFDDVWNAEFGRAGPLKLRAVPIEAVRAGDRQVIAAGYPEDMGYGPVLPLDKLADFSDVCSVLASTIVTAGRPLRNVRHLILLNDAPPPDEATLRNLPQLETFFAGTAKKPWPEHNVQALRLNALPGETLARLALSRWCVDGLEPLSSLVNLRDLRLLNCSRPDSVRHLGALTKLRHLYLRWEVSGWKSLRACAELEEVSVSDLKLVDLRAFTTWTRLRRFRFGGKLRTIAGCEAFRELEEFRGNVGKNPTLISDVKPLQGLPHLSALEIDTGSILDISPLSDLPALRSLRITGYPQEGQSGVVSLQPLARCLKLEELFFWKMFIKDGDLSPLLGLPNLRRFDLEQDDGSMDEAVAEFQRRRPDVDVHYDQIPKKDDKPPGIQIGQLVIHPPTDGIDKWYIFDDLVNVLGGSGNASVERKVWRTVKAKDPKLLERLEFDSEADNFSVLTKAERDIRAVAEMINELAAERGRRKGSRR